MEARLKSDAGSDRSAHQRSYQVNAFTVRFTGGRWSSMEIPRPPLSNWSRASISALRSPSASRILSAERLC